MDQDFDPVPPGHQLARLWGNKVYEIALNEWTRDFHAKRRRDAVRRLSLRQRLDMDIAAEQLLKFARQRKRRAVQAAFAAFCASWARQANMAGASQKKMMALIFGTMMELTVDALNRKSRNCEDQEARAFLLEVLPELSPKIEAAEQVKQADQVKQQYQQHDDADDEDQDESGERV